ncbi:tetratricopeptide repeat protein [Methylotuvimicrobium buryatense]|uniref:Uncharacterized protein n=1 Tax=Methylotuvimicrobium buryatense TaxID=95641 RepID=A0A4P9ULV0_METBY|nr:hypothetical protein [Methylotuvimicrobium buryatense]QCW81510.1 hypothetical protein EQU24_04015 [Methylotuvimicrobium buryatense]
MKRLIFVVFLLLPYQGFATELDRIVHSIEAEWASIYFSSKIRNKENAYTCLLDRTKELANQIPDSPELMFWQATIIASRAEHQNPIEALAAIHKAQDLLLKTISIKPDTLEGSALITLGSLYYQAPGWPIAFGDDKKAEQYLKKGLQINPKGIESNFYYGQYLLNKDRPEQAIEYFKTALKGPIREEQKFADSSLKEKIKMIISKTALGSETKKKHIASL